MPLLIQQSTVAGVIRSFIFFFITPSYLASDNDITVGGHHPVKQLLGSLLRSWRRSVLLWMPACVFPLKTADWPGFPLLWTQKA